MTSQLHDRRVQRDQMPDRTDVALEDGAPDHAPDDLVGDPDDLRDLVVGRAGRVRERGDVPGLGVATQPGFLTDRPCPQQQRHPLNRRQQINWRDSHGY